MQNLALTIAPIFVIVVLGNVLRRLGLPGDAFWPQASRLGYWVLIPSLLFYKLSTAEVDIDLMAPFTLGLGGAFFLVGFVILLVSGLAGMSGAQRGSVLQGAVRHNSFMALAVAETLYGSEGLSLGALAAAVLALVTNLVIVPVLKLLGTGANGGLAGRQVLKDIVCNPLILSICAGLAVNALVAERIPVLHDGTAMLGAVALPLMLLCVGAGLRLKGLRAQLAPLALSTAGRFVLFPAFVLLIPTGLDTPTLLILLIFAAVPTAPSSTALAGETGGNTELMNAIVTFQTGLAFVTLPLTLALAALWLG